MEQNIRLREIGTFREDKSKNLFFRRKNVRARPIYVSTVQPFIEYFINDFQTPSRHIFF